MTIDEKRKAIDKYCESRNRCIGCPLEDTPGDCIDDDREEIINLNYNLILEDTGELDPVNSPSHYADGKIEVIDFIEDKKLGFCLGNVVKYVARAGKKDPEKEVEDLKKARWYLERRIKELEEA